MRDVLFSFIKSILFKFFKWIAYLFEFMHSPFTVISKEVEGKVDYKVEEDSEENVKD